MTDCNLSQEAIEAAHGDGAFQAECFVQSLHDHGAAMGEREAEIAFFDTVNDLIAECARTEFDIMTMKRMEGFLTRIGARLWQFVSREGEA